MSIKELFLLDPTVVYLNHGSQGATPRVVFDAYQEWQRKFEFEPIQFGRYLGENFKNARQALADEIHAKADDVVYVINATMGVNIVSRSLKLQPGDEILTTDHEYGACNNAWEFACTKTGAKYVYKPVTLPVKSQEEIVEQFWQGVTPRTKVIYLSHVTSPTAFRLPIEPIIKRAKKNGILTVIDGAHAPGQFDLDMEAIGADFYVGNCHKWMMSPKGAGFLYTRHECQDLLEPLIVSWGYDKKKLSNNGSAYIPMLQTIGTKDYASYLSVPAAIQFMHDHNWKVVRQNCCELLRSTLHRIQDLTGLPALYPDDQGFYSQMAIAPLPPFTDPGTLYNRLFDEFRIEIPVMQWQNIFGYRISAQGYNTQEDMDTLVKATGKYLKEYAVT